MDLLIAVLSQIKQEGKASSYWIKVQGDAISTVNTVMPAFKKSGCSLCCPHCNMKGYIRDRFMKNVTHMSYLLSNLN